MKAQTIPRYGWVVITVVCFGEIFGLLWAAPALSLTLPLDPAGGADTSSLAAQLQSDVTPHPTLPCVLAVAYAARLKRHTTAPRVTASQLGTRRSEGCEPMFFSLNDFTDRHTLPHRGYERSLAHGVHHWVLREDRTPSASPRGYRVMVDSTETARAQCSLLPKQS